MLLGAPVMARRGRDAEKERFWRDAIRRQARSGLTIRGFCSQERLSEPGFHWWRRELARGSTRRATHRRHRQEARFVPITLTPDSHRAVYEVLLRSGVRVLVHASADEKLADVLAALEKAAC
jgi:hypothetical protein